MPAGGFVGESKTDILNGLKNNRHAVARYVLVSAHMNMVERQEALTCFMHEAGLSYPIVLKPDAGQRGAGVAIVRSDEQRDAYLRMASWDFMAQEYVLGAEFGVFYYRYPGERHGRIFSITEKIFPSVTGDGRRTLGQLILDDDRAVCMAGFYMQQHHGRLDHIPAKDERVQLIELGTHCRGAVFRDGRRFINTRLEEAIDELSRGYEGFFFGRYDIRTPDVEAFARGQNFMIIELNGVTSEATNIYDADHSLLDAYRILARQWKLAFQIGAMNRTLGFSTTPTRTLLNLYRAFTPPEIR